MSSASVGGEDEISDQFTDAREESSGDETGGNEILHAGVSEEEYRRRSFERESADDDDLKSITEPEAEDNAFTINEGEEDDFGDFAEEEEVNETILDRSHGSIEESIPDFATLTSNEIKDRVMRLFNTGETDKEEEAPTENALKSDRSTALWQQMIAPVTLQPPDWKRSKTRRLFLVSLGIPVDLDEILPSENKAKKLVLASEKPRDQSPLRGMSNSVAPKFDTGAARRLCQKVTSYLSDEELVVYIANLKQAIEDANASLTYWLGKREEKTAEKETLMTYVDSFVSHAERQRKGTSKGASSASGSAVGTNAAVKSGKVIGGIAATLLSFGGVVCNFKIYAETNKAERPPQHLSTDFSNADQSMSGRPNNLTSKEEAELKAFWTLTYRTFGLQIEPRAIERKETENSVSSKSTKKSSSKKLFGLGKSKKPEEEVTTSDNAADTSPSLVNDVTKQTNESDDKYSQTKEFKQALAKQTPQQIRDTFWNMVKADHPDALLLRFLRARKWNSNKALIMMIATLQWRLDEMNIEDLMFNGEEHAIETKNVGFMKQFELGKSYIHGVDRQGRPITVVRARLHFASDQSAKDVENFTVWTMETARLMLKGNVDTATIIFDLSDMTLKNVDYTPIKFLIKCFEAHYPESLGAALVYRAPWIFQGVWKIIKGWLDPVVASKIHFVNNHKDLEEYIESSRIVKELGGSEDWAYAYQKPVEGENALMKETGTRRSIEEDRKLLVDEFEKATREWLESSSDESRNLFQKRTEIAAQLAENYWKLDPYLRARSYYDRTRVIGKQGGFVYPEEK